MGRVNTASTEPLSAIQQEVLIGTLLGDGRLECRSKIGSARLRIHHAESQKDFLIWKYEIFQNLVRKQPWRIAWNNPGTGVNYAAWFFHTRTLFNLYPYYQLFYPTGKKIIPQSIGKFLTPRTLAIWFADDGCLAGNYAILNTQCFTIPEQTILQKWFRKKFSIEATLNKDRLTYRLRMSRKDTEKFQSIIRPYVPESMHYKLTPRND